MPTPSRALLPLVLALAVALPVRADEESKAQLLDLLREFESGPRVLPDERLALSLRHASELPGLEVRLAIPSMLRLAADGALTCVHCRDDDHTKSADAQSARRDGGRDFVIVVGACGSCVIVVAAPYARHR